MTTNDAHVWRGADANLQSFRVALPTAVRALNEQPLLFGPHMATTPFDTTVLVSSKRLYVVGNTSDTDDCKVDAECITMHALDGTNVLVQAMDNENENTSDECTLSFSSSELAQEFYDALTRLVELHPMDPHADDTDYYEPPSFGWDGPVVTAPENGDHLVTSTRHEPSEAEREAMLNRLDALLVVPPELQTHNNNNSNDDATTRIEEGQFDDADDDHDAL